MAKAPDFEYLKGMEFRLPFLGLELIFDPFRRVLEVHIAKGKVDKVKEEARNLLVKYDSRGKVLSLTMLSPGKLHVQQRRILNKLADRTGQRGLRELRPELVTAR